MEIRLIKKDAFFVCGYAVETTLSQNDEDIPALYDDFFTGGKEAVLAGLKGSKKGYYGLTWYTEGHARYAYLLGIEAGRENALPEGAILKEVPKGLYAVAGFGAGEDIIAAWTAFFYAGIPKMGLKVDERPNIYFEYYPHGVKEEYELWVPVIKTGE